MHWKVKRGAVPGVAKAWGSTAQNPDFKGPATHDEAEACAVLRWSTAGMAYGVDIFKCRLNM